MEVTKKEKGSGVFLSFLLTIIFFALVIFFTYLLSFYTNFSIKDLNDITIWEFTILVFAAFRLTRLLVYDQVSQFIRDMFLVKSEKKEKGIVYTYRSKPKKGLRRLFADLLGCPWCVGVWISVFTVALYYLLPITWYFWLVLAIAGVSSFDQLLANLIGWKAELAKITVKKMEK